MIFLESPAGVGFSYDTVKNYTSDDDDVSMILFSSDLFPLVNVRCVKIPHDDTLPIQ